MEMILQHFLSPGGEMTDSSCHVVFDVILLGGGVQMVLTHFILPPCFSTTNTHHLLFGSSIPAYADQRTGTKILLLTAVWFIICSSSYSSHRLLQTSCVNMCHTLSAAPVFTQLNASVSGGRHLQICECDWRQRTRQLQNLNVKSIFLQSFSFIFRFLKKQSFCTVSILYPNLHILFCSKLSYW